MEIKYKTFCNVDLAEENTPDMTIIRIMNPKALDPITVFIREFGLGRGRIIIQCYSKAWTAYWGAMGESLMQFFIRMDDDYLSSNLAWGLKLTKSDKNYLERIIREVRQSFIEIESSGFDLSIDTVAITEDQVAGNVDVDGNCRGINCEKTKFIDIHSPECEAEHNATAAGLKRPEAIAAIREAAVFAPQWPHGLQQGEFYQVLCDDTAGQNKASWLKVIVANDWDVHVSMQSWEKCPEGEPWPWPSIRVRTHAGGGKNHRTRQALLWLARAMQLDAEGEQ